MEAQLRYRRKWILHKRQPGPTIQETNKEAEIGSDNASNVSDDIRFSQKKLQKKNPLRKVMLVTRVWILLLLLWILLLLQLHKQTRHLR